MTSLFGWAGLAALSGVLIAAWGHIRGIASQVLSRVVVTFEGHDAAATALAAHCTRSLVRSRFGIRVYLGWSAFVRPRRRRETVAAELVPSGVLYWDGWRPLWVTRVSATGNADRDSSATVFRPISISTLRFGFDVDAFVQKSIDDYNDVVQGTTTIRRTRYHVVHLTGKAGQQLVMPNSQNDNEIAEKAEAEDGVAIDRRLLRWGANDLGPVRTTNSSAVGLLALSDRAHDLIRQIERWLNSRSWFATRGLPWKLGALLYGPPGNGKTALIRAIAEDFDLPVYVFDLATMRNTDLRRSWNRVLVNLPAIALIEDIDSVYDGRKPAAGVELTFDCLLDCLDGVERADGLLVCITTNRPNTIDSALGAALDSGGMSSRPGRIDVSVEFAPPTRDGREHIARRILSDWPGVIPATVAAGHSDTGAQFERRCIDIAQKLFWSADGKTDGKTAPEPALRATPPRATFVEDAVTPVSAERA